MAVSLTHPDVFSKRHIGPDEDEQLAMLKTLGLGSLAELVDSTVPKSIRMGRPLEMPPVLSESQLLEKARELASKNRVVRSFIGTGYSDCVTPPVILRNILENPGWYTAYTPYQAEIAQGRLEALLNYQTMVGDLTGLPIANASLLDEGTAAAEAMTMLRHIHGKDGKAFFASEGCHPQTIDVVRTRAKPLGIEIVVGDHRTFDFTKTPVFGVLLQYPATDGPVHEYKAFIQKAHDAGALVAMAADLLALAVLVPPGELGADVALGSSQRFGVPLGYGGPHAAYFAVKQEHVRSMPGRIIGVSQDAHGNPALRMALGTREQHIRREKATSNICTAQVLLAVIAGSYAVYHGPKGIRAIAERVQALTGLLAEGLKRSGFKPAYDSWFDTVRVDTSPEEARRILAAADVKQLGFRRLGERAIGISLDETHGVSDVDDVLSCFREGRTADPSNAKAGSGTPKGLERTSAYLTHPVFNKHHSETEMLRYLRLLESRDLSLTHSMIPLGSCTMKLNATAEMMPVTMPGFGKLHPFAPPRQAEGYKVMFDELEKALAEITGFPGISLQPNAGSQGEYAGLLVIRKYHEVRGQGHRSVCLIPESAHGTNPASAAMAGMKVVVVKCDDDGNIDVADLEAKAKLHAKDLCALMVTYPSTHGVFEEEIKKICSIVHEFGGQVYMDGANMNAQVGLTRPGDIGADVCHLNLHKTFCLAAGTHVTLADGTSRPIEALLAGANVLAWSDAEKGVRAESLQAVFQTGRKACVEVTLQDGRKITCTPDHRVLTTEGWVEAGDLNANHRVVVGPDAPVEDPGADADAENRFRLALGGITFSMTRPLEREKTLAFFRLLGAVCSDGTLSREKSGRHAGRVVVRLNFGTRYDVERAIEDIARLSGSRPTISRGNGLYSVRMPTSLVRAIEQVEGMGEAGKRVSSERLLPDFVSDLATPLSVIREFLGGLFGGDGCAPVIVHLRKNPANLRAVKFSQTRDNPRVMEAYQNQLCAALGRLGVLATPDKLVRRSDKFQGKGPGVRPRWYGGVTVVDSVAFAERIGFRYCAHKTARLSAAAAFWRLKGAIHAQRVAVAKRAMENVAAAGIVRQGPKSVWRTAVNTAYQQVAAEEYVVNPYYASFEGSERLSKQHLTMAINGAKGLRRDIRGLRRTNRRVLAAPVARDGVVTGVPGLLEFFSEIGASSWFSSHHPKGTKYKVTYATAQEATVEPTMTMRVLDVRPAGDREVYDLTVNDLHSFLANGVVVHNCIPHGGGGPGMGPIGVAAHLAKFLPKHPVVAGVGGDDGIGAISAAPWGSASILLISWAYIRMMGGAALTDATRVAILNANYIAKRLDPHFPVLYKGKQGFVAHECIVDLRPLKKTSGVEAEDVAKRLMDYGFHAPTLSFPVAGTLMIEPTESETKEELDRFCDAMIAIRNEIREVEEGKQPKEGNLLKNAPHTAAAVIADSWTRPYSRERAAFPAPWVRTRKFWPSVGRVNNAFGDRNLVCSCPPIDDYRDEPKRATG